MKKEDQIKRIIKLFNDHSQQKIRLDQLKTELKSILDHHSEHAFVIGYLLSYQNREKDLMETLYLHLKPDYESYQKLID